MGIELNEQQLFAVMDAENWFHNGTKQVYEISGPAGSGKTTIIMYLIELLGLKLNEVLFMAYMGKAATQLARNGLPAKTIHSAIYDYEMVPEIDPETNRRVILPGGYYKMKNSFVRKECLKKKIKLLVVDEGGMVPEQIAKDILAFNLPVIVLGDLNQLPPVFGKSYFLQNPDSILTKTMRQKEGDPIIWLSQQILSGKRVQPGVYNHSSVIHRSDMNEYLFKNMDVVLTERNDLRNSINYYYRTTIRNYPKLDRPYIGEKVICKKNNWDLTIGDGIYFTNGLSGIIEDVNLSSFNGKTIKINFMPDFISKIFMDVPVSYNALINPTEELSESDKNGERYLNKVEYAYAITVHSSQGSQYNKVMFIEDDSSGWNSDLKRRLAYTAVTRARESIVYVIP